MHCFHPGNPSQTSDRGNLRACRRCAGTRKLRKTSLNKCVDPWAALTAAVSKLQLEAKKRKESG